MRSVGSRAISGGAQSGFDHCAGGAFAVGARHVYDAAGSLRMAQRCEQYADAVEAQLGSLDLVA